MAWCGVAYFIIGLGFLVDRNLDLDLEQPTHQPINQLTTIPRVVTSIWTHRTCLIGCMVGCEDAFLPVSGIWVMQTSTITCAGSARCTLNESPSGGMDDECNYLFRSWSILVSI